MQDLGSQDGTPAPFIEKVKTMQSFNVSPESTATPKAINILYPHALHAGLAITDVRSYLICGKDLA